MRKGEISMSKERLMEVFLWKISSELKMLKYRILKKSKEEIFYSSFEIDGKINLYEILRELSCELNVEQLQACLQIPDLIGFLYDQWMKVPDSRNEEMEEILRTLVKQIETDAVA